MKKSVFILLTVILVSVLALSFAACNNQNTDTKNEPTAEATATAEVTATAEPTPTPTATPEPTPTPTPTPVPEPGTYDLLNFEADEDHISGDGWEILDDMWSGPMNEPGGDEGAKCEGVPVNGKREITAMELSNGEIGPVVRLAIDGDEGKRWLGNRYGLGNIGLKPNTKYKVIATIYLVGGTVGSEYFSVLGYAEDKNLPLEALKLTPKDEWQTVEMTFTTSSDMGTPSIVLGPNFWACHCRYDYDLCIEDVEIYEIVGGKDETVENDLLHFTASGKSVEGDCWSISEGKFSGPLQAPEPGTPNEAMTDGKSVYANRMATSTVLPDGTTGTVVAHYLEADAGFRHSGNYYGISNVGLKGNTKYKLTVVLKYTGSTWGEYECVVGFAPTKSDLNSRDTLTDKVVLEAKDEWQTIDLEFTTPETVSQAVIAVGPDSFIGTIEAGYCMYIYRMYLVEVPA